MTTARTATVSARRRVPVLEAPNPKSLTLTDNLYTEPSYDVETREPIRLPVPFSSPLSIGLHFLSWTIYACYFWQRFLWVQQSGSTWEWAIYLCETMFMLQDLQGAMDLSVSLFGPRKALEHPQYMLRGTRAPKVHVLVTYAIVCCDSQ